MVNLDLELLELFNGKTKSGLIGYYQQRSFREFILNNQAMLGKIHFLI